MPSATAPITAVPTSTGTRPDRASTVDDLELALVLADAADAISMPPHADASVDLAVVDKPDGSQVTRFDVEIEARLRALLAEHRPDDAVVGEERGTTGAGARRWIIDPIDGTGAFIERRLDWGTLVALEVDGVPEIGVVSMPSIGRRWWGSPDGAWRSHGDAPPRAVRRSGERTGRWASQPSPDRLVAPFRGIVADRGASLESVPRTAWTTYPALMVAEGGLDLAVHEGHLWDIAALDAVARAAGARTERFAGSDRDLLVVTAP